MGRGYYITLFSSSSHSKRFKATSLRFTEYDIRHEATFLIHHDTYIYRPLRYERVCLPLCKVADTPFHIQGDDIICIRHRWEGDRGLDVVTRAEISPSRHTQRSLLLRATLAQLGGPATVL